MKWFLSLITLLPLVFSGNQLEFTDSMITKSCRLNQTLPSQIKSWPEPSSCTVVMYGDSVTELSLRNYSTNSPVPDASVTPPHMEVESYAKRVWETLGGKATYQRFDSGIFTESGDWRTSAFVHTSEPADWDDRVQRPWTTRYSTSENSALSWEANECESFSFVYRKSAAGVAGEIELLDGATASVWIGNQWINADGYTLPFTTNGTQVYNLAHFRVDQPGRIIVRDSGGGRIQYWGLERYTSPPNRVINTARSGRNIDELFLHFADDIPIHNPDHVLWNVPLINIVNDGWTPAYTYERTTAMINAIAATGAEQVAVIPHYSTIHIGDSTAAAIYAQAEQALIDAAVPYVDMRPDIVHADDLIDNSHLNDSGANKYVNKLSPLLANMCQI